MSISTYIKKDVSSLLQNYKIYIAILGVVVSMFFSLENYGMERSVIDTYLSAKVLSGYVLSYSFAAYAYATVFCSELENRYIFYSLTRERWRLYVIRRVIWILVSSMFVIVMGMMVFGFVCSFCVPWVLEETSGFSLLEKSVFGDLLLRKHTLLFIFLDSVHMGMLAGLLSLMAAWISVYITNRVIILSAPVLFLEVLFLISGKISYPGLFSSLIATFEFKWLNIMVPIVIYVIGSAVFSFGIYKALKRRM